MSKTLYTTFWCYLPFINIYSLQLFSLHIIFAYLYSLLLVIHFLVNQSESDPFIRFEANKYSLRYSLIFASKRISGTPYFNLVTVNAIKIKLTILDVKKFTLQFTPMISTSGLSPLRSDGSHECELMGYILISWIQRQLKTLKWELENNRQPGSLTETRQSGSLKQEKTCSFS